MQIAVLEPLLVSDAVMQDLSAPLRAAGHEIRVMNLRGRAADEIIAAAGEAEVIILANMPLSEALIGGLPRLKMISVAFTGVDHLPMALCNQKGIVVCNAQGYATRAVVEHVFGLLFAVYRKIVPADAATRRGETNSAYFGTELHGKTFGIVGAGAIGGAVAQVAQAFGCTVLACNPSPRPALEALGIRMTDLDDVLRESDVISLHVPLLETTRGLIGASKIALMKPRAVLINAARGPVVDNAALAEALLAGRIAGAGIDVFDIEPPIPTDYPLLQVMQNVVFTPHTAFGTTESFQKRAGIVFANIRCWLEGKPQNLKSAG